MLAEKLGKYANDMTYQIPLLFPSNEMENLAICSSGCVKLPKWNDFSLKLEH